jgi:probable F420-dependent oxidoreductase
MTVAPTPRLILDTGIPGQLASVPEDASTLEGQGYDGCWSAEINHDPFLPLMLSAEHTSRVELGTSIAVAFARNPMTVASVGRDLQTYSKGRFILGLGSQIQAHIEKRFSMPWSRPVHRMREFVLALRAIWSCWHDGTKLEFDGDFYTHKLMTPMFVPEPAAYGFPKIFIAAVGEAMTEMCGETADGMIGHAFTTKRYLDEVTIPTLLRGIKRSGRDRHDFHPMCPVLVVTGEREAELEAAAAATRKQIVSTARPRPTGRCWRCMAGATCRTNCAGCPCRATGPRWDRSSTTRSSTRSRSWRRDHLAAKLRSRCEGAIDRVLLGLPKTVSATKVAEILHELRTPWNNH